ncbi:DUF2975 domain-containing protein [Hasllibacter sp. MH4015]|uniref:DUF2975 domain-containing protein n=1 Tax=Hasllibacter sp. MH4015 TaxID=2854029 RepID=UPI001CD51019|nr:DUF2975 domain-containing protein [Hasllibacter sp. MH4015]
MNDSQISRVQRLARILHWACTLSLIVMPALLIYMIAIGDAGEAALRRSYADYALPDVIPPAIVLTVRAIQVIGFAITLYILWQMRVLFGLYKSGEILSTRCAAVILRCGQALVTIGIFGVLSNTVIVLLLTLANETGDRTLAVQLSGGNAGFFLGGGLIVVIGWVMGEAVRIADENRAFV